MRLGGLAASIFKSKVTLVRDAGEPLHRAKPPDTVASRDANETTVSEPAVHPQFWAHVYGMEGERVGRAFMTREHMERLHAPSSVSPMLDLPQASSQSLKKAPKPARREKKQDNPKGSRVFIGQPLASWKVRAIRDLEPSANMDGAVGGKGKGKARWSRTRWYVGDPAALHAPYGRMPGYVWGTTSPTSSRCSTPAICSDGSLTPLSEPEADDCRWPQPAVGECCEWAPPLPPSMVAGCAPDLTGLTGAAGLGLGLGSGVEATMDGVNGDSERGSVSTGTLSEQDLARAISAALAALSVDLPS